MLTLRGSPGLNYPQRNWLAAAWLSLCLMLGGASQGAMIAYALLQSLAAALIAIHIWRTGGLVLQAEQKMPFYLFAASLIWIAIMFAPLPPSIWSHLPGREFVVRGFNLLNYDVPWLPMALAPERALRSALSLLIILPAYILTGRLDHAGRRGLIICVVSIALFSAGLGLAQLATGPQSSLRFFNPTNPDSPVGLFANANHFAVFLAASLPLAAAWIATTNAARRPKRSSLWAFAIYAMLIAFVLTLGRSVAGIGFLVLALIGSAHIILGRFASKFANAAILMGILIAAVVAAASLAAIGSGAIGAKFEDAPSSRGSMTPVTIAAANTMLPTGAGLGSFVQVYAMHQPDSYTSATWINHAHNDYAELYLELGLPGILLVSIFILWWLWRGFCIWQHRNETNVLISQAAWLGGTFLLLHSMVDYPLRTSALAAFLAAMVAIVAKPTDIESKRQSER